MKIKWKEFLWPSKLKITLFLFFSIVLFLGWVRVWTFCKECYPKPFLYDYTPDFFWLIAAIILLPISLSSNILYNIGYSFGIYGLDLSLAFIPITALYLYILACLLELAYAKALAKIVA